MLIKSPLFVDKNAINADEMSCDRESFLASEASGSHIDSETENASHRRPCIKSRGDGVNQGLGEEAELLKLQIPRRISPVPSGPIFLSYANLCEVSEAQIADFLVN